MRFKRIGAIGGSLITTVCLLSGLMYYFNQDSLERMVDPNFLDYENFTASRSNDFHRSKRPSANGVNTGYKLEDNFTDIEFHQKEYPDACPGGTFLCQNTTMCLPQRNWCNQEVQCPYGDDEADCYVDPHGVLDWFGINRDALKAALRTFVCNDTDTPVGCVYNRCLATCQGYTEIPQNLSSKTISIGLYDSSIERVPWDAFASYSEIRLLYLDGTGIREIEAGAFANLAMLLWLSLENNTIGKLLPGHFTGLNNLESLKANKNRINVADLSDLEGSSTLSFIDLRENNLTSKTLKLPQLPALHEILLDENNFESIPDTLFVSCPALRLLSMQKNKIRTIEADTFQNLVQLGELNLAFNELTSIPLNVFQPLKNLTRLALGYNHLHNLPVAVLSPLVRLHSLDLEGISLETLKKNAFDVFPQLENVYFKKFHYCATYAPKVKWCRPSSDGVSSLSHLLDKILLRTAVWVISCVTCMGNVLVLWGRLTAKDENRVLTIIIRNLAVSDMLMGIYLFVIALADMIFRGNYNQVAGSWMSSWACTIVGVLAMTSLEVSVLILSFMSVERYMLIVAPLKGHRTMTPQTASASMIIIWIIGITLAFVPVIHWRSSTRFYGVNGMCFPLHIDDPYLVGWEYTAFIFLGLNLTGLITIGYVYAGMFASIWKTRHACSLSIGDSEFAMRFFLIVLTDAACWAPIIILKIKAMMKYPIPADLHAWVVVFILPVNSAVNPLLYTFTTPKFRERLSDGWFGKVRNYVTRKSSTDDSQLSTTSNKNVKFSPSSRTNCDKKIPPLIGFNNGGTNCQKRDHIL